MTGTTIPSAAQARFERLFDADFLARLGPLSLRVAQAQKGGRLAEQKTSARGQGAEFADFKPYVAGDDLRAIDWNVYRRLGRLFVRVFEERQDMPVYFLVDLSDSMFIEQPPRIEAALKSTLALAAIALGQHDAVSLLPFSARMSLQVRSLSGRNNVMRVARHLAEYEAAGSTALVAAIEQLAGMKLRRGLVVVVSDFFDPTGIDAVVSGLEQVAHSLLLVQLVRAHDADPALHPDLRGDVLIDDGESPDGLELSVTPELLERYRQAYRVFAGRLQDFSRQRGAGLLRMDAGQDVLTQLAALFGSGELRL
ncbi:hypothetical protein AMP9_4052 [plant metagenome]|uniref:DUF58 domain-containing protein n=1 Tax=plant metagenome TaxID=1297885 RepID=A0A484P6T4_9ZZZZ